MKTIFQITVTFFFLCNHTQADVAAYTDKLLLEEKSSDLVVIHEHDWSSNAPALLFDSFNEHEKFFTEENNFSYIKVIDNKTKSVLFEKSTNAFTHISISHDSDLIVGLSNIKLYNPYQIVVFSREGKLLLKHHISSSEAIFNKKEINSYWSKYPKAKKYLIDRTIIYNKQYYVDCFILGIPNAIGENAFNECIGKMVPAHWSPNYTETVTNRVFWYNGREPVIEFKKIDNYYTDIKITGPRGKIVIFKVKQDI